MKKQRSRNKIAGGRDKNEDSHLEVEMTNSMNTLSRILQNIWK
jgi:hypothetical protein